MCAPNGIIRYIGRVVNDNIIYEGTIADFDSDPKLLLRPFFEKIWEECGLQRPDREKLQIQFPGLFPNTLLENEKREMLNVFWCTCLAGSTNKNIID